MAACSEDRATAPVAPVYDVDVAPILQAHCVACHGDTNPAGGLERDVVSGRDRVRRTLERAGDAPGRRPGAHPGRTRYRSPPRAARRCRADHRHVVGRGRDASIFDRRARPQHHRPALDGLSRRASARVALVADARSRRSERVRPLPRRYPVAPGGRDRGGAGRAFVHELPRPGRGACLRAPRATDRGPRPTRRAIRASSPRTSAAERMRPTSSPRRSAPEACRARRATRCPGLPSSGGFTATGSSRSPSIRFWFPERRATTLRADPAPSTATPRAARSRTSPGARQRRRSDAATAIARRPLATSRAPAPAATRRPTPPAPR